MAEDKGWICLHRKIQECDLWMEKPFSRGQAWIDLLLLANHEDKKIMFDGNLIWEQPPARSTTWRRRFITILN